jgi:hypothetical protein
MILNGNNDDFSVKLITESLFLQGKYDRAGKLNLTIESAKIPIEYCQAACFVVEYGA